MANVLQIESESTLTDRYQTTIPDVVRKALKLKKRDKVCYTVQPDGKVTLSRAQEHEANDPILERFLSFLAQDISSHQHHVHAIDSDLRLRVQPLVANVEFDLDAPLSDEDE